MITRSVYFSIFPLILALSASSLAQDQPQGLSVSISATADRVKSGSPLVIKVRLKNISSHEIWMAAGSEATKLDVLYASAAGQKARQAQKREEVSPPTPDGVVFVRAESGSGKLVTMASGETWAHEIVVTQLFDLSKPGVYTIQAKRGADEGLSRSNIVQVTVTP